MMHGPYQASSKSMRDAGADLAALARGEAHDRRAGDARDIALDLGSVRRNSRISITLPRARSA